LLGRRGKRILLIPLLAAAVAPVACGGGGSAASDATATATVTARTFVSAVTRGDTRSWCAQIGAALLGDSREGGLPAPLLKQCEQHDLFLITGSCDREAAIAGASIKSVSASGNSAEATLSTGASLRLRFTQHRWLIAEVAGGHAAHPPPAGPCSSLPTAGLG
jgi:hypothetical protein